MTVSDIIMVIAILLAPLLAVQIQKWIEIFRETRQRKLYVFHTLMATRAARVSTEHVQALNMIDIIFYKDKAEKPVREAWKKYLDHLNTPPLPPLHPRPHPPRDLDAGLR